MLHKSSFACACLCVTLLSAPAALAQNSLNQTVTRFTLGDDDADREVIRQPVREGGVTKAAAQNWQQMTVQELQQELYSPSARYTVQDMAEITNELQKMQLLAQAELDRRQGAQASAATSGASATQENAGTTVKLDGTASNPATTTITIQQTEPEKVVETGQTYRTVIEDGKKVRQHQPLGAAENTQQQATPEKDEAKTARERIYEKIRENRGQ